MKHHNRGLTSAVEVLGLGPVHRACVTYSLTRVILLPSTVLVTEAQLLSSSYPLPTVSTSPALPLNHTSSTISTPPVLLSTHQFYHLNPTSFCPAMATGSGAPRPPFSPEQLAWIEATYVGTPPDPPVLRIEPPPPVTLPPVSGE